MRRRNPLQHLPSSACRFEWRTDSGSDQRVVIFQDPLSGKKQEHIVSAGPTDHVACLRRGPVTFVYSENSRYGYAGLEAFQADEPYCYNFLQMGGDVEDLFGPKGLDVGLRTAVSRLARVCIGEDGEDAWGASAWFVPKLQKPKMKQRQVLSGLRRRFRGTR